MATDGEGVDIIVNALKEEEHMNICWESMKMNGELIQVGVEESQSLCMRNFLNSQSFLSLDASVLINCNDETKEKIRDFISKGLETGLIKPTVAEVDYQNIKEKGWDQNKDFSYSVIALNKTQVSLKPTLNVTPDNSYAIIGGNEAQHVAEWLMQRGARKILIEYSNGFRFNTLSPLLEKYGAVVMVSRNNTSTLAGTEAFFADVRSLGDMAAVFAVNLTGESAKIKLDNIKKVCDDQQSSAFLSSLLCSKNGTNNWHLEIRSGNSKTVAEVVATLDEKLKSVSKFTTTSDVKGNSGKPGTEILFNSKPVLIDAHLPLRNSRDLYDEVNLIEEPQFEEQPSLSLRKKHTRDLMSVFCFPGLSMTSMKQLIKNLIYPSFLAHIPAGWSMNDIIVALYKNLKEIQPKGLYTFITESWSGIIALKLAEYLEKKGDKVTMIFLDASPYLLKDIVQQNKETFSSEKNLASFVMQKENMLLLDAQKKANIEQSSKIILDRVRLQMETEINHEFKGQCVLVTSEKYSSNIEIKDQYKMFKTISEIFMTSIGSPFEFSSDRGVVSFINYNVPVTWW